MVNTSHPSLAKRRTSADPTMPRWPATHTRRPSSRNCEVGAIAGLLRLAPFEIGIDHLGDQPGKVRPVLPAELLVRLRSIAEKEVDFGGPEVTGVDGDEDGACLAVEALLLDARSAPFDRPPDARERRLDEFAHGVRFA